MPNHVVESAPGRTRTHSTNAACWTGISKWGSPPPPSSQDDPAPQPPHRGGDGRPCRHRRRDAGRRVMLAFSNARRAVACAQAIHLEIEREFGDLAPPIRVRIGVHTGDAIKEAEQYIGSTVHFAARVGDRRSAARCSCPAPCTSSSTPRPRRSRSSRVARWSSRGLPAGTGCTRSAPPAVPRKGAAADRVDRPGFAAGTQRRLSIRARRHSRPDRVAATAKPRMVARPAALPPCSTASGAIVSMIIVSKAPAANAWTSRPWDPTAEATT